MPSRRTFIVIVRLLLILACTVGVRECNRLLERRKDDQKAHNEQIAIEPGSSELDQAIALKPEVSELDVLSLGAFCDSNALWNDLASDSPAPAIDRIKKGFVRWGQNHPLLYDDPRLVKLLLDRTMEEAKKRKLYSNAASMKAYEKFVEFQAKAKQGNANYQRGLGDLYFRGEGVEKNPEEAVNWWRKAAEQGEVSGQLSLASAYRYGRGVEKDPVESVKWYRAAAEQGFSVAELELGICYRDGEGTDKNPVESDAWLALASTSEQDAANARDALEKSMSPQEISNAKTRTEELRAQIAARHESGK